MPSRSADDLTTAPARRRKSATNAQPSAQAKSAPADKATPLAEDYTGEAYRQKHPQKYARAVEMLGAGISRTQISEMLGMACHTVAAVEKLAYGTRQQRREYLADKAYLGAAAALDAARQKAAEGNATAMDAKRLAEAWLVLNGETAGFSEDDAEERHAFPQLNEFLVAMGEDAE